MKLLLLAGVATVGFFTVTRFLPAQDGHDRIENKNTPAKQFQKPPAKTGSQARRGRQCKDSLAQAGTNIQRRSGAAEFKLVKGKKGHHVHVYVDNELVGMFQSDKGTLNGIKPGKHTLELVVVAQPH
jgi:hypothetical protein